ncbi:hypothetical protein DPMN_072041 [Dreissena polymorpha]|uniref:Uncharacterized protein n=1 Tax=Dreissena polymorpha TaxID=45954 RepID=A0A9D3Z5L0_DREPO|nr:hypothetical protein DPMN_072041 [Dreissena polymorpha]
MTLLNDLCITSSASSNVINTTLKKFWSLESMGINDSTTKRNLQDALEQYQDSSIQFCDGRYVAKLPWKDDHLDLPSNLDIAL